MALKFNLRKLRTDLGLKQSELADALQLPQSSVSAMENGKTGVSPQYITKLQTVYHISNIDDYFEEVEVVRITGNRGNNNGYKNTLSQGLDAETVASITEIKKVVESIRSDYEARLSKAEEKREEQDLEIKELHKMLTAFQVLCARHNIDYDHIIAE